MGFVAGHSACRYPRSHIPTKSRLHNYLSFLRRRPSKLECFGRNYGTTRNLFAWGPSFGLVLGAIVGSVCDLSGRLRFRADTHRRTLIQSMGISIN
ncbi:hypothetical protein BDV06DRAFT_156209 [Aspergillus oleicola]